MRLLTQAPTLGCSTQFRAIPSATTAWERVGRINEIQAGRFQTKSGQQWVTDCHLIAVQSAEYCSWGWNMSDDNNRLKTAQWVFERNLAWINAAEVKVGVIVAIDTAMLAGLAAAFSASDQAARTPWAYVWIVGATVALAGGIFCASMAVLPRLDGPPKSLVFFGRIWKLGEADYVEQFKNATDEQLLDDWTAQIHRNAQIACNKFQWVRSGMVWSFLSVVPWFPAMLTLVKK